MASSLNVVSPLCDRRQEQVCIGIVGGFGDGRPAQVLPLRQPFVVRLCNFHLVESVENRDRSARRPFQSLDFIPPMRSICGVVVAERQTIEPSPNVQVSGMLVGQRNQHSFLTCRIANALIQRRQTRQQSRALGVACRRRKRFQASQTRRSIGQKIFGQCPPARDAIPWIHRWRVVLRPMFPSRPTCR